MRKESYGWALILPSFLYLIGVIVVPWIYSIYLSFTNLSYTSPGAVSFVWDNNFRNMFNDPKLYAAIGKTATIMIPALALQIVIGLFVAWGLYLLGTSTKVRVLTTIFILPIVMSSSVIALTWYFILHSEYGVLTYILRSIGLLQQGSVWSNPNLVILGYILVDTWQWLPFVTLLFWAGMNAIPRDLVESSSVDGARGFFYFRKVIFPSILPLFAVVMLLRGIDAFKIIDPIIIITYGGPGDASETLHFFNYREAFRLWNIGYASTIGLFIFFVIEIACALYVKFFISRYVYAR
ncbi:MAG: sugar ABC transporter permease [Nitrososphaerota archaeon]